MSPYRFPLAAALTWLVACAGDVEDDETTNPTESETPVEVDADDDGFPADVDCNDADPAVNPDADEICDGIDNDCDNVVDGEGATDAQIFYADKDGDGFGDREAEVRACAIETGLVEDDSDCNDASAEAYPGGTEVCDRIDNDCDGLVDFDGWIPTDYATLADAAAITKASHLCLEAGTYTAQGIMPLSPLTLEGSGIDRTIIEGANDILFVTTEPLTLRDLTVANVGHDGNRWTTYGTFAFAEGAFTLEDVRFDAPTITHDYGTLLYSESVDVTWRNVEVDSPVLDIEDTWYGLVYTYDGHLDLDGVHVHDGSFRSTDSSYGTFYQEYARTDIRDVVVENNTFDFRSLYGLVWCSEESDDSGSGPRGGDSASSFANVRVANNTVTLGGSFYGTFSLDDYDGFYRIENVEILGNTVTTDSGSYGWLGYDGGDADGYDNVVSNLIIAGNHQTVGSGDAPLVYDMYDMTATNWDLVANTYDAKEGGALVYADSGWNVRNLNLVGNDSDAYQPLILVSGVGDIDYVNVFGSDSPVFFMDDNGSLTPKHLFELDPDYASTEGDSTTWDLTLAASSQLVDIGDPAILDADGTRSDLGAFGGPGGDRWAE